MALMQADSFKYLQMGDDDPFPGLPMKESKVGLQEISLQIILSY
jgi:hypothetical protein